MSLDREYFQVVGADSGIPLSGLSNLANEESARAAAVKAAVDSGDTLAVTKVTVLMVATFQRTVSVATTDLP